MDDYWDEPEEKMWGSVDEDLGNLFQQINVPENKPIKKPKPKEIVPSKKRDYAVPIQWSNTMDMDILKKCPLYKKTTKHTPIPHDEVLKQFRLALKKQQLTTLSEKGILSEDGFKYFYNVDVITSKRVNLPYNYDYYFNMGFVNFNQRFLWGCAPIHGETMKHPVTNETLEFYTRREFTTKARLKHTVHAFNNIRPKCQEMVRQASNLRIHRRRQITQLKNMECSDRYFSFYLLNLMRKLACSRNVLSVSQVEDLITTWDKKIFPRTLWGFHQAFVDVFQKISNPTRRLLIFDYYSDLQQEILKKRRAVN